MGFELDKVSLWNVGSIPARGQYFFRLRVVKTRISKLASESRLWLGVETHPQAGRIIAQSGLFYNAQTSTDFLGSGPEEDKVL